ncbi:MAG: hypothetical protein A2213_11540 [Lysobacterales bacterium RIFOXYA1_FULL_68_6]|nr:MAG: hypothetical protein A2213_11540 [Xanthomonadales bacterium RIFOXYA1_FULL_68_6]
MRGAYQVSVLALQELARRPVQPASRMRADIQPRACFVSLAMKDQRFRIPFDHGLYFGKPAVGDVIQCTESHGA